MVFNAHVGTCGLALGALVSLGACSDKVEPRLDAQWVETELAQEYGEGTLISRPADGALPNAVYFERATPTGARPTDSPEMIARQFISENPRLLAVPNEDLELTGIRRLKNATMVFFTQRYRGFLVQGTELQIRIKSDGSVLAFRNSLVPGLTVSSLERTVRSEDAKRAALDFLKVKGRYTLSPFDEPWTIVKVPSASYRLTYRVGIFSESPVGEFLVYVDAASGQVAKVDRTSTYAEIVGRVVPDRAGDEPTLLPLPFALVTFDTGPEWTDTQGRVEVPADAGPLLKTQLEHPWFRLMSAGKDFSLLTRTISDANDIVEWNDREALLEETTTFYWLSRAIEFTEGVLGVTRPATRRLLVLVNFGKQFENAFYMPLTHTIAMGSGSARFLNTAHFRDIIIHEFHHSITHGIYGLGNTYEFSAMNEAFSDYFAAALTGDPEIATGVFADFPARPLRAINQKIRFPHDLSGQFHVDSRFLSTPLWKLREGSEDQLEFDRLAHAARMGRARTISDFILDLLYEDDEDQNPFNGSPNMDRILDAFKTFGFEIGMRMPG